MKDQTDKLDQLGIDAFQVNSGLTKAEADEALARARAGAEFVLTTPERLAADPEFVDALKRNTIDRFVVDEAHCVSRWGHDFRPAFADLKAIIERLGHPPVLALTATATPAVVDDIVASLGMRDGADRQHRHLPSQPAPRSTPDAERGRQAGATRRSAAIC